MTTGIVRPAIAGSLLVRSLNCLQNSIMLTCAWPSAGPTGGAGVALAAMIWSLTYPVIFFGAIFVFLQVLRILCCGQEVEDPVKRPDGLLRTLNSKCKCNSTLLNLFIPRTFQRSRTRPR